MHRILSLTITLTLFKFTSAQHVFINQVPEYSSLSSCAEVPLSTIVRDMEQGCGDGGKTTSYSCFCTASSSEFSEKISKAVASDCTNTAGGVEATEVLSAVDVFSAYCALGTNGTMTSSVPAMTTGTGSNATTTATNKTVVATGSPTLTQGPTDTTASSGTTTTSATTSAGRKLAAFEFTMFTLWVTILAALFSVQ